MLDIMLEAFEVLRIESIMKPFVAAESLSIIQIQYYPQEGVSSGLCTHQTPYDANFMPAVRNQGKSTV
jgi:hypothetical protein